jgi:hypothetical protein
MTSEEILKFLGILILRTRYQFGNRSALWSNGRRNAVLDPRAFGTSTGIPLKRYDALFGAKTCGMQSKGAGICKSR